MDSLAVAEHLNVIHDISSSLFTCSILIERINLFHRVNELKSQADSFAKKAAALFNIFLSIRSRSFSPFTRLSSACNLAVLADE